jgi:AcrR family transcriptional regulator
MTMPKTKKPTKTRPASRRPEILAVAADLFAAKGYGATAMSDLAGALGMQKASLYHHVRTKETLLYELSLESMQRIKDAAAAVPPAAPRPYLEALIRTHVLTLLADQSKHATALTELRCLSPAEREHVTELRDSYDRVIEEAIRALQAWGDLWPNLTPKVLRLSLLGMLNWSVFWYRPDGEITPEELAETYTAVFLGNQVSSAPTPEVAAVA